MRVLGTLKPKAASGLLQDSSFEHFRTERQSTDKEAFKESAAQAARPFRKIERLLGMSDRKCPKLARTFDQDRSGPMCSAIS